MNPSNKLTTEQFISKAKSIHGDKFDYSKTKYVNSETKVCIACPTHGESWILPYFREGKITERVHNALMKYEIVD